MQKTTSNEVLFRRHYIQNMRTGKRCRVYYSVDNRVDGRKCVTLYAKGLLDYMDGIIDFKNGTDVMTDYFETDKTVIFEGHPQYAEARLIAEKIRADLAKKYAY